MRVKVQHQESHRELRCELFLSDCAIANEVYWGNAPVWSLIVNFVYIVSKFYHELLELSLRYVSESEEARNRTCALFNDTLR